MTFGMSSTDVPATLTMLSQFEEATRPLSEVLNPSHETRKTLEMMRVSSHPSYAATDAGLKRLELASKGVEATNWTRMEEVTTGMARMDEIQQRFQEMQVSVNRITGTLDILRAFTPDDRADLFDMAQSEATRTSRRTSTTAATAAPISVSLNPTASSVERSTTVPTPTPSKSAEPLAGEVERSILEPNASSTVGETTVPPPFLLRWTEIGANIAYYHLTAAYDAGVLPSAVSGAAKSIFIAAYFDGRLTADDVMIASLGVEILTVAIFYAVYHATDTDR